METSPPPTSAGTAPEAEDTHKIAHKSTRSPPVEVITRGERRRIWTPERKRDIVVESFGPDLTPTEVVRKYGISSGQLYTWRQRMLSGPMTTLSQSAPSFAQVDPLPPRQSPEASDPASVEPAATACGLGASLPEQGVIEIILANGVTLRVDAQVDGRALRRVLDALAER